MYCDGSLLKDLVLRERGEQKCRAFRRRQHFREADIYKLGLHHELKGHQECVNCLQWNEDGTLIASGSDDTHCIIWDPFKKQKVSDIETGHEANIFSVNFMPQSKSALIATCAGDGRVKVWDINHRVQIYDSQSHFSRVKRLASANDTPSLFWSAGEDGLVVQHDLREPQHRQGTRRALISMLAHTHAHECKCIAINQVHTHLLALGSGDIYVRLFDRRMLSSQTVDGARDGEHLSFFRDAANFPLPQGCVRYYTPGHMPSKYAENNDTGTKKRSSRTISTTYIAFSTNGSELLANYNAEHIYLFDLNGGMIESRKFLPPSCSTSDDEHAQHPQLSRNGFVMQTKDEEQVLEVAGARCMKDQANEFFHKKQYFDAIKLYNLALKKCPQSSVLWSNRSAALMKRKHDGDIYEALLNAYHAFCLNCANDKACFRIIRNLIDLRRFDEARQWLAYLKQSPHTSAMIDSSSIHRVERELDEHYAGENDNNKTTTDSLHPKSRSNNTDTDSTSSSSSSDDSGGVSLITSSRNNNNNAAGRLSQTERLFRSMAFDYTGRRYTGHCNTNTDIKEACFMGGYSQFVGAGSDDGCFYIWDKHTTNILRAMRADSSIVNCLAVHPEVNMLATSGIDNVVRLWTPSLPLDETVRRQNFVGSNKSNASSGDNKPPPATKPAVGSVVDDYAQASENNAKLMSRDPFERIFLNMREDFPLEMFFAAAANRARASSSRRNNRSQNAAAAGSNNSGEAGGTANDSANDAAEDGEGNERGGEGRFVVPVQCSNQ